MKKIIFILILFSGLIYAQNADKRSNMYGIDQDSYDAFENTDEAWRLKIIGYSSYTSVDSIYGGADTLTTSWDTLGTVIDMRGFTQLNVYATLTFGDTGANARLRALGGYTGSTCYYPFAIETISSSDVKIEPEYLEFNTDIDQYAIIKIETDGVPYILLQGQVGVADSVKYTDIRINKIWK